MWSARARSLREGQLALHMRVSPSPAASPRLQGEHETYEVLRTSLLAGLVVAVLPPHHKAFPPLDEPLRRFGHRLVDDPSACDLVHRDADPGLLSVCPKFVSLKAEDRASTLMRFTRETHLEQRLGRLNPVLEVGEQLQTLLGVGLGGA